MLRSVHLYRPHRTAPEVLERTFVGRAHLLSGILEPLGRWQSGRSRQHHLLIGPRGIGKTNLLQLIAHRIQQQDDLSSKWTTVVLPEDFYGLSKLSDLLLETVRRLAESTTTAEFSEVHSSLRFENDDQLINDRCLDALRRFHRQTGRGVVLMIENLDRLIERQIKKRQEAHRLRRILIEEEWLIAICTSPTYLDAVSSPDEPFFEFFKIHSLGELSQDEQEQLLYRLACEDSQANFEEIFHPFRPRLKALYHFTGGNPRLTVMLYDLLVNHNVSQVHNELDLLLDQLTPFYQDRMKEISEQEARVLETMSLLPEGCSPTDLAKQARLPAASVRATFTRLERAGYIRREQRRRKQTIYVIPERFFRIWHQMNHSRSARGQIQYLLEFFSNWYASREERDRVWEELIGSLANGPAADDTERAEDLTAYMDYIVAVSEGTEYYQRLFERQKKRLDQGSIDTLHELSSLDREHCDDADYFFHKGHFLATELKDFGSASIAFETVLRLRKADLANSYNYGVTQLRLGHAHKAKRIFSETAELLLADEVDPSEGRLDQVLSMVLFKTQNRSNAMYASYLLCALASPGLASEIGKNLEKCLEPWRRRYAINTLGYLGQSVAVPKLIDALRKDIAQDVQGSAATALGRIGDPDALPALIDALGDQRSHTRGSAATALGRIGDPTAVPDLIRTLDDPDDIARASAATALGKIAHKKALPGLIAALSDPANNVRGSAATALGKIGDPRAVPPLVEALGDPSGNVRSSVAIALGRLGQRSSITALVAVLDDPIVDIRRNAAISLGRLAAPMTRSAIWTLTRTLVATLSSVETPGLSDLLGSFLNGVFGSGDLETIAASLESLSEVASPSQRAAWTPHSLALSFLQNDRDPALLELQQPEMREAMGLLVGLFDATDQEQVSASQL